MSTTANQILAHITKAREAEKNVTAAPWKTVVPLLHVQGEPVSYTVAGPPSDFMYIEERADADFISAARTDLPKCWEALEVLTKALDKLPTYNRGEPEMKEEALSKVNSILARP